MKPSALVVVPLEKGYLVTPVDVAAIREFLFFDTSIACSKLGGSYSIDRGTVLDAVEAHFNPPQPKDSE